MLDAGYSILDALMLDPGYSMLEAGYSKQDAQHNVFELLNRSI
jgi:hypothetical protein